MISSLNGKLIYKNSTTLVVECGGVGYQLSVSLNTSDKFTQIGEVIFIFTVFQMRENEVNLYGFLSEQEREAFRILNSVSGIGAKTSLGILSSVSAETLAEYIVGENMSALQKLPGIGKKTAERLCFELKDKAFSLLGSSGGSNKELQGNTIINEAVSALISLGYSRSTAEKAVKSAQATSTGEIKIENIIKSALKFTTS
ncbi:MAG: Holliday junction branch migration protein RuvA [Candidatus Kapaibacterium sp.]